jgi:hypothetical protein
MHSIGMYINLGFQHISDLAGYDHILFLLALCAVYSMDQWRRLFVLVTAFTVGHSITLALSSFGWVVIPSHIIEFLIPVTILITAMRNVAVPASDQLLDTRGNMTGHYLVALCFGFIHGMGFSNYFRALMMDSSSITIPLLGFNLGIEIGQLLVVSIIVIVASLVVKFAQVKHRDWNLFISGAAAGISIVLMIETAFW